MAREGNARRTPPVVGIGIALAAWLAASACGGDARDIQLQVRCEPYIGLFRVSKLVTPGSEFEFSLEDRADGPRAEPLRTSDPVDAPGFELSSEPPDENGWMRATAPDQPGIYTWTIESGDPVEFIVYEPDEAEPWLHERTGVGDNGRAAVLGLGVDGTGVCVHDREEIATVTVAGEGCRPVLSGFELEAPFRAIAGDGDFEFELFGEGSCQVTAELAGGQRVSLEYPPAAEPVPALEAPERVVTDLPEFLVQPIGPGGDCPATATDGDCDAPYYDDGDCYWDADWGIAHFDPAIPDGEPLEDGAPVGDGLSTRLDLDIHMAFPGVVLGPPTDVTVEQESGGLFVDPLGCEGDYRFVEVTGLAAGAHDIVFHSSNTSDTGETTITVRPVTDVDYSLDTETGSLTPGDAAVEMFVRTRATLAAAFRDGDTPLHGVTPIEVTTDDPTALSGVTDPDVVVTGETPHTLVVDSRMSAQTLTIAVRDVSGISSIGDLEAPTLAVGEEHCHPPVTALGAGGAPILGRPPTGPRVSLAGGLAFTPLAFRDGLCLRALAPGDTTVSWSWGSATQQTTWRITP